MVIKMFSGDLWSPWCRYPRAELSSFWLSLTKLLRWFHGVLVLPEPCQELLTEDFIHNNRYSWNRPVFELVCKAELGKPSWHTYKYHVMKLVFEQSSSSECLICRANQSKPGTAHAELANSVLQGGGSHHSAVYHTAILDTGPLAELEIQTARCPSNAAVSCVLTSFPLPQTLAERRENGPKNCPLELGILAFLLSPAIALLFQAFPSCCGFTSPS